MAISKSRKNKRKGQHYKQRAALFILMGGHHYWLDGASLFTLNQQIASIEAGDTYFTKRNLYAHFSSSRANTGASTPQAALACGTQGLRVQDQQGQDAGGSAAPLLGCDITEA